MPIKLSGVADPDSSGTILSFWGSIVFTTVLDGRVISLANSQIPHISLQQEEIHSEKMGS